MGLRWTRQGINADHMWALIESAWHGQRLYVRIVMMPLGHARLLGVQQRQSPQWDRAVRDTHRASACPLVGTGWRLMIGTSRVFPRSSLYLMVSLPTRTRPSIPSLLKIGSLLIPSGGT